jgi:hypothetical protein
MSTVKVTNIQHGSATNVAMVLDTAGTVKAYSTIGVGNTTPAASGAGITFPATASASSDANTLDDYEEGTFTPSFANSGTGTYSVQQGAYTKIGNTVKVHIFIQLSSVGTASGDLTVTNLPFSARTGLTQAPPAMWSSGWTSGGQPIIGLFSGTTIIVVRAVSSGSAPQSTHAEIGTGNIIVSGVYLI